MSASGDDITCILNGAAGSNRARDARARVADLFARHGANARVQLARDGNEIAALVQQAKDDGQSRIVAGGGDGTVNAVAAALIGAEPALGVLPLGTLNHFAKDLNIPLDLDAAVANVCTGRIAHVDVGSVNDRVFLNNSSLGLYPAIVRNRERQQHKGHGKWLAFAEATFFVLRRYSRLTISLKLKDQYEDDRETPFVFVGNNQYNTTGLHIGERARLDGGKLWIYIAPHARRATLFRLALKTLVGGQDQGALEMLPADEFRIGARKKRLHVALDGEVMVLDTPLHYLIRPAALRVIVPASDGNRSST